MTAILTFAKAHPDVAQGLLSTVAKNPAVVPDLVTAIHTGNFSPLVGAHASVVSSIFQQLLGFIEANPQVLTDLISVIESFFPKA